MPEVLEPEMDCKGVIRERILTEGGSVGIGDMSGLNLLEQDCHHVLYVKWRCHSHFTELLSGATHSGPVVDTSGSSCSYYFSGQGEMVPTSGGLTLIGARCDYCPLGPVASERASY